MSVFLALSSLTTGVYDGKISVKVLARWFDKRDDLDSYFNMILADKIGTKIEASIPKTIYEHLHAEDLFKGSWFEIKGFNVAEKVKPIRNCSNDHQIVFTMNTTFVASENLSQSRYFEFKNSYTELLKGSTGEDFPIDLYGVVKNFSKPERIPYVPREDDVDYQCMDVRFEVVDHDGNFIKCCAIGDGCTEFMNQWVQGEYDLNFVKRPKPFCVLQFWRTSQLQGEKSAINNVVGCSKIMLDPHLEELEETRYV